MSNDCQDTEVSPKCLDSIDTNTNTSGARSPKGENGANNSPQLDYFSLQRSPLYGNHIARSPLGSPREYLSTGSEVIPPHDKITSFANFSSFLSASRPHTKRVSSNLNLMLSPLVTTPNAIGASGSPNSSYSKTIANSPISSTSNVPSPFVRDHCHPSVLFDLEEKVFSLLREQSKFSLNSSLPHDYLNILLKDGRSRTLKPSKTPFGVTELLTDYTLLSKIYDDDSSDVISSYFVENKESKKKFVVRFVSDLTIGSVSRLMNSYYVTTDLKTRIPRNGFPHLVHSLEWNYQPRTLPKNLKGISRCSKLEFSSDHSSIAAFYPINDNMITLKRMSFSSGVISPGSEINSSYSEITDVFDISKIIQVFINILKVIKLIHSYGIVNNSLTSSNILINPETLEVSIFGFDFSFSSTQEYQEVTYRSANKAESLNYIPFTAPENFDRLIPVDYRADIYSAGTILYSLFLSKFHKTKNLLQMVVSKTSLRYTPLHEISIKIPIELSRIISRMIEVDASLRYSSIDYIIYDLIKLLKNYNGHEIADYKISTELKRIPIFPQCHVIGREECYSCLIKAIESKTVSTYTLKGQTGVGKTSILESLKNSSLLKKKFFTIWKCHSMNFIDAKFQTFDFIVSQLLKDVLTMDKNEVLFWRNLLSVEIKSDLSILYDSIPEMKALLGPRYKYMRSSKTEKLLHQKELSHQYILKKIFELFSKHTGWVLVIENIDEMSETECSLLDEIWVYLKNEFSENELNFTLLTSYTENDSHTLDDNDNIPHFLKKNVIPVDLLSFEDVKKITIDSLHLFDSQFLWKEINSKQAEYYYELYASHPFTDERRELVKWIYKHSQGNPLKVKQIITQLHFASWELKDPVTPIEVYKKIRTNVDRVFLCGSSFLSSIAGDFGYYGIETMNILKFASCICDGNSFNLHDLSIVTAIDAAKLHKVLFTGMIVAILVPCSVVCKLSIGELENEEFPLNKLSDTEKKHLLKFTKFKFMHDSIQQHFVDLMKESKELEEFHRICGLRLFSHCQSEEDSSMTSSQCLAIAYHFLCSWKVARSDEFSTYCNILITAGWCAYSSYENSAALKYFQTAKELTEDEVLLKGLNWVEIHIHAIKGKHQKCIELIELSLTKYSNSDEDRAQLLIAKSQSLRLMKKFEKSYEVTLEIFRILKFPLDLKQLSTQGIIDYTNNVLKPKLPSSPSEIRKLKGTPKLTDRRILLTQMILSQLNHFAILMPKPELLPFSNFMNFILFMEHGKSTYCGCSLIYIASYVAASNEAHGIKKAQEYSKLAFSLVNGNNIEDHEPFTLTLISYCSLFGSMNEPVDNINQSFDLAIMNLKTQMTESVFSRSTILRFKYHVWLFQGMSLQRLIERGIILVDTFRPTGDDRETYDHFSNTIFDALSVFTGESTFEKYTKTILGVPTQRNGVEVKFLYNTNKCLICYMLRKYEVGADIAIQDLYPTYSYKMASFELPWSRYVFSLVLYKERNRLMQNSLVKSEQKILKIDKLLKETHAFLQQLSDQNLSVSPCLYYTVDALIKTFDKNYSQIDALSAFDHAIETCTEYHNYLFEAIAAEECGRWLRSVSKSDAFGLKYLKISHNAYKSWGLTIKVDELLQEFGSSIDSSLDFKPQFKRGRRASKYLFQNDLPDSLDSSNEVHSSSITSIKASQKRSTTRSNTTISTISALPMISRNEEGNNSVSSKRSSSFASENYYVPKSPTDSNSGSIISEGKVSNLDVLNDDIAVEEEFMDINIEDDDWDNEVVMNLSIKIARSTSTEEIFKILISFGINFVNADYACLILNSDDGTPFVKAICLKNDDVRFLSGEILSLRGDLVPVSLICDCLKSNVSIWRESDKFYFDTTYRANDEYFESNDCENIICIPIRSGDNQVVGALYLENQRESSFIRSKKIDMLEYVALQSSIAVAKNQMFSKLEIAKKTAEDATADRTSFLANMSHEIRTPFNSLMSCAIFLLDTPLTKTQRMYVETIKNSALVTLNIIDGILSFSKLEHGSLTLAYEPFSLSYCIEDSIQLVAEQAATKGLELCFINNSYPVEKIFGDQTRITQVIINLLGNATKFTSSGHVVVETCVDEIAQDRYEFKIYVRDSGIGIPDGSKSRLFKAFNQLDGSARREYGGAGLGLAISKKLAEYMGGDLDYESIEGKGTNFCFTFTTKGEKEKGEPTDHCKGTFTIFDDRELSKKSLVNFLVKREWTDLEIKTFDKITEETKSKTMDADFVFIHQNLVKNEAELESIRSTFKEKILIFQVPFGVKIPDYVENEQTDTKLVDYVLLNPFRRSQLEDILKNGKKQKVISGFNGAVKTGGKTDKGNLSVPKLGEKCPLTILVAEDNAVNTKVVQLQLKRLGYTSDHAKDGVEAVEKAEEHFKKERKPYDLILMDLQMPRKDGIQATVEIRAQFGDRTRVVALSANVYTEEKNKCQHVGMSGFLNKPLLPEALADQLQQTYDFHQSRDPK